MVARAGVLVDHDGRNAQLAQPGTQRDSAFAAADNHDVGLLRIAQRRLLFRTLLRPRPTVRIGAVHGAKAALD
jgi:hypothetical protein